MLIPPAPGILCALGLLVAPLRLDLVRTRVALLDAMTEADLAHGFDDLAEQAALWLDRESVPPSRRRIARAFDLRYVGQNFELTVTPPAGASPLDAKALHAEFLREHERVYGYAASDEPVQIVALRLTAFGDREIPAMPALPAAAAADPKEARIGERAVYDEEARDFLTTPVYRRERLRAGHRLAGPAIVEQMDSTTVILGGQEALVDAAREPGHPGGQSVMDRITLDVIGAGLLAIAEEMGEALIKSSYSTNIKERQDCSTALFNVQGEVIAQAEHIPMHLGSLIMIIHEILRRYPLDQLRDGDVFVGNDPYTGGSTHLPDITVASPVFAEGTLIGFVANIAHHADGSGRETRSIWDEGLRIPPIRIAEGGRLREDVMELILLNFHLPRERRGDFRAQFAANRLGAARLKSSPAVTACPRAPRRWTSSSPMASARSARRSAASPTASMPSRTGWTTTAWAGRRCPCASASR